MKSLSSTTRKVFPMALASVCLSVSIMASAQAPEGEGHKLGPQHLIEVLNIGQDQQTEFLDVLNGQHEKRMDIHNQYRESHTQERASMALLHEETLALLQSVLTSEQLIQFTEMAQRRHKRKAAIGPQKAQ